MHACSCEWMHACSCEWMNARMQLWMNACTLVDMIPCRQQTVSHCIQNSCDSPSLSVAKVHYCVRAMRTWSQSHGNALKYQRQLKCSCIIPGKVSKRSIWDITTTAAVYFTSTAAVHFTTTAAVHFGEEGVTEGGRWWGWRREQGREGGKVEEDDRVWRGGRERVGRTSRE